MAYKEEDKLYALIKYADEHPGRKLKWCDIVAWIHDETTRSNFPRVKELAGIKEYQFSRPVTKNGKKAASTCKKRFDEINKIREAALNAKLPDLISVPAEKFLKLSPLQQIDAIKQVQKEYRELLIKAAEADQEARSAKVESSRVEQLKDQVDELIESYTKSIKLIERLVKKLNEAELIRVLEQYGIPGDTLDHVKIRDDLEAGLIRLHSIKEELKQYKLQGKEGGAEGTENQPDIWDISIASVFK